MSDRKVAVVTGTSSGIGLHTAIGLARRDIRVVATMRDTGREGNCSTPLRRTASNWQCANWT
ncbi:SDR family NAD(P)-dependent oxidoreductase [Amycolatopsis sp. WGS_07]|uniref:SDR family NAD(P)-dependent oxidoreductase n=1 Tax=Amycolatopsis sp. WGS_07 TaxID=3076764 RepID=UPI003873CA45